MINPKILQKYHIIHFIILATFFVYINFERFHLFFISFGGAYRFWSDWGFAACVLSCYWMLSSTKRKKHAIGISVISAASVSYAGLYWVFFLGAPGSGALPVSFEPVTTAIIHSVVPLLQIINTIFFVNSFQRLKPIMYRILVLTIAYVIWLIVLVAPLNDTPSGTVTSGYPYPFLNNLSFIEVLGSLIVGIVLLTMLCALLVAFLRRLVMRWQKNPVV